MRSGHGNINGNRKSRRVANRAEASRLKSSSTPLARRGGLVPLDKIWRPTKVGGGNGFTHHKPPPPPAPTPVDATIAVVLSAGSLRVAFEVGAVRFLYGYLQSQGKDLPGIICGTSGGAINAAKLAEGGTLALDKLETLWLQDIQSPASVYDYQAWLQDLFAVAPDLIQKVSDYVFNRVVSDITSVVTAGGGYLTILGGLYDLWQLDQIINEAERVVSDLSNGYESGSIFYLGPLENLLQVNLLPTWVAASGVKLRIPVVSLRTGLVSYIDENATIWTPPEKAGPSAATNPSSIGSALYEVPEFSNNGSFLVATDPLIGAVLASASTPIAFPPTGLIYGSVPPFTTEWFTDGGVRRYLDIGMAIDAGAQTVYAITPETVSLPVDDRSSPDNYTPAWSLGAIVQRIPDIVTTELVNSAEAPPVAWPAQVTVVRPAVPLAGPLVTDPGVVRIEMGYGFMKAADAVMFPAPFPTYAIPNPVAAGDQVFMSRMDAWQQELNTLLFVGLMPPQFASDFDLLYRYGDYLTWLQAAMASGAQLPPGLPSAASILAALVSGEMSDPFDQYNSWRQSWIAGARQAILASRQDKKDVYNDVIERLQGGGGFPDDFHWGSNPPDALYPWDDVQSWCSDMEAHQSPTLIADFWAAFQVAPDDSIGVPADFAPQLNLQITVIQKSTTTATTDVMVTASDASAGGITNLNGVVVTDDGRPSPPPLNTWFSYTFVGPPKWIVNAPPYPDTPVPVSAFEPREWLIVGKGQPEEVMA